eukprot:3222341-Rhodomonas_salina.1
MRFRWMTKPSLRIERPVAQRNGPRRAFHVLIRSAMAVTLNSGTGVVVIGHLMLSCWNLDAFSCSVSLAWSVCPSSTASSVLSSIHTR